MGDRLQLLFAVPFINFLSGTWPISHLGAALKAILRKMYFFTDFHIPTFKGLVQFLGNIVSTYPKSDGCFPNIFVWKSMGSSCSLSGDEQTYEDKKKKSKVLFTFWQMEVGNYIIYNPLSVVVK